MIDPRTTTNDLPALPESSVSYEGGSNGSIATGKFASGHATREDLTRGFSVEHPEMDFYDKYDQVMHEQLSGGFLGRPGGWER